MDDDLVNEQCKGLLANATERWADGMPRDLTGAEWSLSETPTIRRGEFITCEAGHLICEAIGDIRHGQVGYAANLGAWRLETPPQPGDVDPRCPCGVRYFRLSPGPSLHVKGRGWV